MRYNNYSYPSGEYYYQAEKKDSPETPAKSEETSQSGSEADIAKQKPQVRVLRQMAKTAESVGRTSPSHRR